MWDTFSCCVYWALFAKLKLLHKHDEMKTNKRQVSTCSLYLVHWEGRGNEFKQYTLKMSIKFSCLIHQICPVFKKCFNVDIISGWQKQWCKTTHTSLYTVFIPSFYSFLDSTSYCNRMTLVLTHSYSYPLLKPQVISQVLWLSLANSYNTWLSSFTTVNFQTRMGDNHLATTISIHKHTIVFTPDQHPNLSPHPFTSNSSLRSHERTLLSTSSTQWSHSSRISYS
jgi:hypothetical protein